MPGNGDDDVVGPFFLVKGNIVSVDGKPATGTFLCRGVVTTNPANIPDFISGAKPLPSFGVTFVDQSFQIDGRGIIFGSATEFNPSEPSPFPSHAIIGGTGEFTGISGRYTAEGAPFEPTLIPGGGKITFKFTIIFR